MLGRWPCWMKPLPGCRQRHLQSTDRCHDTDEQCRTHLCVQHRRPRESTEAVGRDAIILNQENKALLTSTASYRVRLRKNGLGPVAAPLLKAIKARYPIAVTSMPSIPASHAFDNQSAATG